jgi:hydrogenase-4 component B
MFLFASFGLFYAFANSFDLVSPAAISQNLKLLIFFLAFVGFGSKAGVFPFHIWLPHAHPAAPSHISAIMSGVMIKMGIYGILRMYLVLSPNSMILPITIIIVGIISGFLGVIYALGQSNIKKALAYSSIENIGIILIGIGLGMLGSLTSNKEMALLGYAGALMHILNHAMFKSLLFMGAGSVLHSTCSIEIEKLGGLIKKMQITGVTFLIGSVAISGLPPLNGFVSEFLIYLSFFKSNIADKWIFILSMFAIISLALIGGLAVACFTRIFGIVFLGEPRTNVAKGAHKERPFMIYSMIILTFICIIIGILPGIFLKYVSKPALLLAQLEYLPDYELKLFNIADISGNISLAALFFCVFAGLLTLIRGYFYAKKEVTRESTWGCGFSRSSSRMQYTGSSFASTIMEFNSSMAPLTEEFKEPNGIFPTSSKYFSKINDIAEVFIVNRIVFPFMRFIKLLRWIQHGEIQLYVAYIVFALLMMLFVVWVWR